MASTALACGACRRRRQRGETGKSKHLNFNRRYWMRPRPSESAPPWIRDDEKQYPMAVEKYFSPGRSTAGYVATTMVYFRESDRDFAKLRVNMPGTTTHSQARCTRDIISGA